MKCPNCKKDDGVEKTKGGIYCSTCDMTFEMKKGKAKPGKPDRISGLIKRVKTLESKITEEQKKKKDEDVVDDIRKDWEDDQLW